MMIACAGGTAVATADGYRPVETLRPAEILLGPDDGRMPVVQVNRRIMRWQDAARPDLLWPVRVRAHAFAPSQPARDLILSPQHAIFLHDVLIPVRYLVNGASVAWEPIARISYWQVQLATHGLVLAEGLVMHCPPEFGPAGDDISPSGRPSALAAPAPLLLVTSGDAIAAARRSTLQRLPELGFDTSPDPLLEILADGLVLGSERAGGWTTVLVPDGATELQLLSRDAAPLEFDPSSSDARRLGVAVTAILVDGQPVALDDARMTDGWHHPEPGLRWTDGRASLDVRETSRVDLMVITNGLRYVVAAVRPSMPIGSDVTCSHEILARRKADLRLGASCVRAPSRALQLRPVALAPAALTNPRPTTAAAAAPVPRYITTHPDLREERLPPLPVSISVIIPTRNAGDEFAWLVRKLFAQIGVGRMDVIVVDSGSSDQTVAIAEQAGCRVIHLAHDLFSHSHARNLGASHAQGELIVFMVQDAYPIGDTWLLGLADCLLRPRTESERVRAVSCAEFSRTDCDLLYNVMLQGHYAFIGCGDRDRVGELKASDHVELRRQGQLSDVACMMQRSLFLQYGHRGRFGEDLTLGIRLIRDGHRIAMLSSIRVIHSHRRPAGYYLRRVFVDVVFLAATFPDFHIPAASSAVGAIVAAFALAAHLPCVDAPFTQRPVDLVNDLIDLLRRTQVPVRGDPFGGRGDFGYPPLGEWIDRLAACSMSCPRPLDAFEVRGAEGLQAMFIDRLQHLTGFIETAYPVLDQAVAPELAAAIEKTLAMTLGAQLAFSYLSPTPMLADGGYDDLARELKSLLFVGI